MDLKQKRKTHLSFFSVLYFKLLHMRSQPQACRYPHLRQSAVKHQTLSHSHSKASRGCRGGVMREFEHNVTDCQKYIIALLLIDYNFLLLVATVVVVVA